MDKIIIIHGFSNDDSDGESWDYEIIDREDPFSEEDRVLREEIAQHLKYADYDFPSLLEVLKKVKARG